MKRFHLFFILSISISLALIFILPIFIYFKPFFPFADYLLGNHKSTSYLILLGNDTEMRANGGFAGSYAKIKMNTTPVIARNEVKWQSHFLSLPQTTIDLDFQDIYVPDGQVQDFVAPPAPIQTAFGHGTWQLANADWEPDFPTSTKAIRWFFEKGNEVNPDILAIVNLSTIKDLVNLVGSFPVPEYGSTITPENLYLFLQGKAEVNFFPGSTQKKDALYAVGHAFFKKVKSLPIQKKYQLAKIIFLDLVNKNIVVNSLNPDFQNLLIAKDFAGVLESHTEDSYALIETNLGANKANAYVTRTTTHEINFSTPTSITHKIHVNLFNSSPSSTSNPPFHYGGDYVAYLRFYLPRLAQDIQVTMSDGSTPIAPTIPYTPNPQISPKYSFTEVAFWQITQAGRDSNIDLSYTLPLSLSSYSLTILKQHGMRTSPQSVTVDGQTLDTPLTQDFIYLQKKAPP